jgi:hypothetical protein
MSVILSNLFLSQPDNDTIKSEKSSLNSSFLLEFIQQSSKTNLQNIENYSSTCFCLICDPLTHSYSVCSTPGSDHTSFEY